MLKRIGLFLLTNIAVIALISILLQVFNVQPYLDRTGLNYGALLAFSAIIGFAGSFVSLALSKWLAKKAHGVQIIDQPRNGAEDWLLRKVRDLASQMGIGAPEVGIYESPEPNAFATGWNRNKALVAVSTGLLEAMNEEEVEAVLAHEVGHVANGDMVTLALVQGVLNTFVVFFARIAAYLVSTFLARGEEDEGAPSGIVYFITAIVFQIAFGVLASMVVMWFSRFREYRADAASARAVGAPKMISALRRLQQFSDMPARGGREFAAMKIRDPAGMLRLFSSHPPLEARIEALQKGRQN